MGAMYVDLEVIAEGTTIGSMCGGPRGHRRTVHNEVPYTLIRGCSIWKHDMVLCAVRYSNEPGNHVAVIHVRSDRGSSRINHNGVPCTFSWMLFL
jgi:hypothetical protein